MAVEEAAAAGTKHLSSAAVLGAGSSGDLQQAPAGFGSWYSFGCCPYPACTWFVTLILKSTVPFPNGKFNVPEAGWVRCFFRAAQVDSG